MHPRGGASFACGQLQVELRLSGFGFWQINEPPSLVVWTSNPLAPRPADAYYPLAAHTHPPPSHFLQDTLGKSATNFGLVLFRFAPCGRANQLISKTCNFNFVALVLPPIAVVVVAALVVFY